MSLSEPERPTIPEGEYLMCVNASDTQPLPLYDREGFGAALALADNL